MGDFYKYSALRIVLWLAGIDFKIIRGRKNKSFRMKKQAKGTKLLELTLLLASALTILANAIIAPALPQISNAFSDIDNAEILTKLMMTLPALIIAVAAPLAGRLMDKSGRIKVLIASLIIYLITGTSGYWLDSLYLILIGRVVFGIGVAGIMTVATTLIGDYFSGAKREHFMGLQGAFIALGGLVFITIAGVLTDIDWRLTFLVYGFSIVVLILVPIALYEPNVDKEKIATLDTGSQTVPKAVWLAIVSAFIVTVGFYVIPVQLPYFLQRIDGMTGNLIGLALGSLTLAQAVGSFSYKKVKSKFNYISVFSLGFIPMAIGFTIIGFSCAYWQVIVGVMFCGLGVGLMMPNANLWVINIVPVQFRGKYVGGITTATFLGMFLSPIFIQPIQDAVGMNTSFIILGISLAVFSMIYALIQKLAVKYQH